MGTRSGVVELLRSVEFATFSEGFMEDLDRLSNIIQQEGGKEQAEEQAAYAVEFLAVGATNLAVITKAFEDFPRFFGLPFAIDNRHLVLSSLAQDTYVVCERFSYSLSGYSPRDRALSLSSVQDYFTPFSGDIRKSAYYNKIFPKQLIELTEIDTPRLFENLNENIKSNGRLRNDEYTSAVSLMICCEMPLWKIGAEIAINGPEDRSRFADYSRALRKYISGLRMVAREKGLEGKTQR